MIAEISLPEILLALGFILSFGLGFLGGLHR